MEKYLLTLNDFIKFINASSRKKESIIKDQLKERERFFLWNQSVKWGIIHFWRNRGDASRIHSIIDELKNKKVDTKRKDDNRRASIFALETFLQLPQPEFLTKSDYKIIDRDNKEVAILGVRIKVTPEVIFQIVENEETFIGGIKFHLSKDAFDAKQGKLSASILKKFLENEFRGSGYQIKPEHCLYLELHSGGYATASKDSNQTIREYFPEFISVKKIWDKHDVRSKGTQQSGESTVQTRIS